MSATLDDVRTSLLNDDEQEITERLLCRRVSSNRSVPRSRVVSNSSGGPITSIKSGISAGVSQLQNFFDRDNRQWVQAYQRKYIYPALVMVPLIILFIMTMVVSISLVVKLVMGLLCILVAVFFYVYVMYSRSDSQTFLVN